MSSSKLENIISPIQTYIAISVALLIPVVIWPLQLYSDHGLNPAINIHQIWMVMAAAILLCSVTADSIIGYRKAPSWPFVTSAWICLTVLGVSIALRLPDGTWLMALMFALHSLRAAAGLWHNVSEWHLWPAWSRDTMASAALFFWHIMLNQAS
ncbi:hypothetical protein FE236_09645 [Mariprofundus erugo]|uniref:DUF3429 domain-containing protein n=1 Tax=Mariprofundus erugo TaxID=2528639 RepID=A0A5R9GXR3_9PROT|nr:hypothetical protein [Mariprofundus erugo]TLS68933.1 hypothetical protein FEF65_00020 [Mariprofundus erugo]TLS75228.1 hypothetical protein FE236_09645 [Mariprofundus erugo]